MNGWEGHGGLTGYIGLAGCGRLVECGGRVVECGGRVTVWYGGRMCLAGRVW